MNLRELLIDARDRIADPERWCQHHSAEDASGTAVASRSTQAVRWCALGSSCALDEPSLSRYMEWALRNASDKLYGADVEDVNDDPTLGHAAVMAIYDYAIQHAE